MRATELLARRPVSSYVLLVFLVAWGAVVAVVGPASLAAGETPSARHLLPVFAAMLLGPALAGLLLTALTAGRPGVVALWDRQRRWRVPLRWYAVAVLTTPALLLCTLGPLSVASPAFVPAAVASDDVLSVLGPALAVGLFAGLFEEVGWTGFALPTLRARYGLLTAGVALGVVWGAWHGLADYWGNAVLFGDLWTVRIALWISALTAYRVLIAWVYEHTRSLLLAQVMHASFTGSQGALVPDLSPAGYLGWYALFAVALWAVVLVVAWSRRTRGSRGALGPISRAGTADAADREERVDR
ncbi:MAG: lysostaphin resistance A-like protein [Halobacteriaceae archaeon]